MEERVYISGPVVYGDRAYRVASFGTLLDKGRTFSLVTIDMVGLDANANVFVENKYIYKKIKGVA